MTLARLGPAAAIRRKESPSPSAVPATPRTPIDASAPLIVRRRLADLDPLGPVAASLVLAGVLLLPAAIAAPPEEVPPADALASIAVLGVVCTALGLVLFFRLVAVAGPSRASVITYVNPLVAVALGVLVLDERLGTMSAVGLVLILAGSWLATGGRPTGAARLSRRPRARPRPHARRGPA